MRRYWIASAALIAGCAALWGSGTATWEMTSYQDFIRGRFQGVSLSREGRLSLAPKLETLFNSDQPIIWSAAEAPDGSIYVGTGHRGRVYRIDPAGKSSILWTADQPEVFAIAVDKSGVVYTAGSPDGKIYRIVHGKAEEFFDTKAKYVWSLAVAPDGVLFAGTGDAGKIYRIPAKDAGELYYDTGQSHVTALAFDRDGRLLAGSEPNGILYRVSAKDKAFVLYDANLPEIRAIVPAPDGTIYAAALGGSVAQRVQSANQSGQGSGSGTQVTAPTTTITVEAQAGGELKPNDPLKQQQQQQQQATATSASVTTNFSPVVDMTGVDKSAVYRINPDNTVETLWTSKEENVYDLLNLANQILFSTDSNGRVYGLSRDRKVTLVLQTNEGQTTRLIPAHGSVLAATGNMGRIYRIGEGPGASGSYESPIHDAGTAARWGGISWRGELPPNATVAFRTRTGNSLRPDRTWSDWSAPLTGVNSAPIKSPNARYIQWKAELAGASDATPVLNSVTVSYLPQNSPPVVKSVNVSTAISASTSGFKSTNTGGTSAAYSVTVSDTPDGAPSTSSGTASTTLSRSATQQINIAWSAEDPDGDRLVFALYFRGEDEREWKLLRGNLHENSMTFDGDVFADGKYFFRVVASDREANAPAVARSGENTSSPVVIDNTPPLVTLGSVRKNGAQAVIEFEAVDAASPLRRCEYSLDATGWVPVEATDGVIDTQREKFVLNIDKLTPGEHLLVVRAVDSANNAGLAKVVLK